MGAKDPRVDAYIAKPARDPRGTEMTRTVAPDTRAAMEDPR